MFDFALHNTGNKRLVSHRIPSPCAVRVSPGGAAPSTWPARCAPESSCRDQRRAFSSPPGQRPPSQGKAAFCSGWRFKLGVAASVTVCNFDFPVLCVEPGRRGHQRVVLLLWNETIAGVWDAYKLVLFTALVLSHIFSFTQKKKNTLLQSLLQSCSVWIFPVGHSMSWHTSLWEYRVVWDSSLGLEKDWS